MSDDATDNSSGDQDVDPGPPVTLLARHQEDSSPELVRRVRRNIYRRMSAAQFASFSWNVPKLVLREFLEMLVAIFGTGSSPSKGGRS